jgi:Zn-dependent peptidase ImmA (M78 family)
LAGAHGSACLGGEAVYYDATARSVRQHGSIAHECAHFVLRSSDEDDPEPAARYVAGALMLPRAAFDRDLRETAWNLDELRRRHPNVSAEMIARRVVELRDAVVTILDAGKVRARVASPWSHAPAPKRLTPIERELLDAALASGEAQRANDLLSAWPVFDGRWRRVIVVAETRQLSLRL